MAENLTFVMHSGQSAGRVLLHVEKEVERKEREKEVERIERGREKKR